VENTAKRFNKRLLLEVGKIVAWGSATLVFLLLPADFFDSGETVCLSRLLLDIECYACGMTRAVQHLIHFDWELAYEYNPLSFIVAPVIAYIAVNDVARAYRNIKKLQ
jgi:hypothetical protein